MPAPRAPDFKDEVTAPRYWEDVSGTAPPEVARQKYKSLRFVVDLQGVIAVVVFGASIIIALVLLFQAQADSTHYVLAAVGVLLLGGLLAVSIMAAGQVFQVLMDIEDHLSNLNDIASKGERG